MFHQSRSPLPPRCLQVGDPMSYHRESWMMEKDEKLQTVPLLHMEGNTLVKQRKFSEAASKYKEAVLLLKTVQSRVRETRRGELGLMDQNIAFSFSFYKKDFSLLEHAFILCEVPLPALLCFGTILITGSGVKGFAESCRQNTGGRTSCV